MPFYVIAGFLCAATTIENRVEKVHPWNKNDERMLAEARMRCVVHYPESPCVARFVKWGQTNYGVVCGKEIRRNKK